MAKVYFNGEIIDETQPAISVSDSGFLYGAGLFETMRAHNGKVFCLNDHLDRLYESAKSLSIVISCSREQIEAGIAEVLEANKLKDARLRLTVSNGPIGLEEPKPTMLITTMKYTAYPDEFYKKGISVVLSNYRQSISDPLGGYKTTSYFSRLIALEHARQRHCMESLWFTVDNRLAEGSISNVFVVKDDVLYTPPVDTPVLPGIARKNIGRIAVEQNLKLIEKNMFIHDLLEADEVFITNVIMKVMPVVNIEKHDVKDGKVGKMSKRLMECFDELIKKA
jgi:branched-chain amino acid aminotransferase